MAYTPDRDTVARWEAETSAVIADNAQRVSLADHIDAAIDALLASEDGFTVGEADAIVRSTVLIEDGDYTLDRLMAEIVTGGIKHLYDGACPRSISNEYDKSPWGCSDPACVACRIQRDWLDRVMA